MLVGRYTPGSTPTELVADTKLVVRFLFPGPVRIPKLTMYLDGGGAGTGGQQLARGIIYSPNDILLGEGEEIVVQHGQAAGWVDLPFKNLPGGIYLPEPGWYSIGIHAGPATNIIRTYA